MTGSGNTREPGAAPGLPPWLPGPGYRVFSSPRRAPRFRRATDVLILVPSLLGLTALLVAYPPGRFERSLAALVAAIPSWLSPVGALLYELLGAAAIAGVLVTLAARRLVVFGQIAASLALTLLVALGAARLATGEWPNLGKAVAGGPGAPEFPGVRLAVATTVVLAISPHLVQPLQRAGRYLLALGFLGALVASGVDPAASLAGVLTAVVASSGARLAFGTSAGLPTVEDVTASLAQLRLTLRELRLDERELAGVVLFTGTDEQGAEVLVKVHGRDAYDNKLLEKLWRTLWYKDGGPSLRLSRGQAVDHEAFATLLAGSNGIATHEVVRAGTTARGDALIVLRGSARLLETITPPELDAELLRRCWQALDLLHTANIAHGHIDGSTLAVVRGSVGFVDFSRATAAPRPDQLMTDRAQLLVTSATLLTPAEALAAARDALGPQGLSALLPYLQVAALEDDLRRATRTTGVDVDRLRRDAAALVGEDEPGLVRLRRVTWRSLVQAGLLILAAFAVLSFAGGIDYEQFFDGLSDATWSWIALGAVVAQTPRFTQAVATLGSVAASLRFGPVYAMQLATGYMNLALPSMAGRLAINIRFFQRQGITAAAALTSGAIDSFASTVVQAVLLTLLLIFSSSTLDLQLETPSSRVLILIAVLAALLTAAIAVAVLVPRIRNAIVGRVRSWWPEVSAALGALRSSNKLALLLVGTVATEVLFAITLGLFALGLGTRMSVTDLLVINISTSLFASLIPIPGGIGVTELGLTVGLTTAGMSEEAALATALLYRIAVFYVPPIWGFFALRWLQRNRYL